MADFADRGHRPHASYPGEAPETRIDRGPYGLRVSLDTWGPQPWETCRATLYRQMQSNWGRSPMKLLSYDQVSDDHVEPMFAGKTLQQPLEALTFAFTIDGCTRAATHQIVRTRIGAAFMQHGGRDNDWRHQSWTMPETIDRACRLEEGRLPARHAHCIRDHKPLDHLGMLPGRGDWATSLRHVLEDHLERSKQLYAALVDAGIPWQDARRLLPIGLQTYIHATYTYPALAGVLANRLEHVMDWEINCIAQLMLREVKMHCPPLISRYLGSHSDKAGYAKFGGLESWPPDGKWVVRDEQKNLLRTHRPEQNPFWVLHPDAMAGGPIVWIPTNGTYPERMPEDEA